ncbi:hypothetical protein [Halobacterium sp. KA-6]|uniref:hypothetical protein n=1 Tax=Halobacterium sp. KA-6 TaxID=2896368 RepID=UPI001E2FE1EF|nr:hypothetical protein [Halobacterium sp. KA-6]MCD2202651.1 hypothetical protein [Halobacterium sp. KA-6]
MDATRSRALGAALVFLGLLVVLAGGREAAATASAKNGQFAWWVDAIPPLIVAGSVGGSAVVAGALGYRGYRPRYATSAFTGTATAATALVLDLTLEFPAVGVSELDTLVATGVLSGGAAWYVLGYYWR